jgi:hypothetical protein
MIEFIQKSYVDRLYSIYIYTQRRIKSKLVSDPNLAHNQTPKIS